MTKTKRQSGTMQYLSTDELLRLLRVARKRSVRDWCMALLSYKHGLRSSEICKLRRDDIDDKANAITVQRLKGSMRTVQPLYAHRGQPLLDEQKAVKAYLAERPNDGGTAFFISQKGGHLDRSAWFRVYQAIAEEAGLPMEKRHPHCLKHSLASHLISKNTNLALVKQALGHQTIDSTLKYIGTTDAQAAEAVHKAMMDLF